MNVHVKVYIYIYIYMYMHRYKYTETYIHCMCLLMYLFVRCVYRDAPALHGTWRDRPGVSCRGSSESCPSWGRLGVPAKWHRQSSLRASEIWGHSSFVNAGAGFKVQTARDESAMVSGTSLPFDWLSHGLRIYRDSSGKVCACAYLHCQLHMCI